MYNIWFNTLHLKTYLKKNKDYLTFVVLFSWNLTLFVCLFIVVYGAQMFQQDDCNLAYLQISYIHTHILCSFVMTFWKMLSRQRQVTFSRRGILHHHLSFGWDFIKVCCTLVHFLWCPDQTILNS